MEQKSTQCRQNLSKTKPKWIKNGISQKRNVQKHIWTDLAAISTSKSIVFWIYFRLLLTSNAKTRFYKNWALACTGARFFRFRALGKTQKIIKDQAKSMLFFKFDFWIILEWIWSWFGHKRTRKILNILARNPQNPFPKSKKSVLKSILEVFTNPVVRTHWKSRKVRHFNPGWGPARR